jgi:hypothetical protein
MYADQRVNKDKMRWSLRFAIDDEAVYCSGRDDDFFGGTAMMILRLTDVWCFEGMDVGTFGEWNKRDYVG